MTKCSVLFSWILAAAVLGGATAHAQTTGTTGETYRPTIGQPGKDVVWVPTPAEMVGKMLDLAAVTPKDLVIDLGSGDGRNVIAAAKRGARARGVEYNPDLVELSRTTAKQEGVADKATFVQGDMYEADFSDATVLALFLLPENLRKLTPRILELKPGTRIVANTFGFTGWTPAATTRMEEGCQSWCEAMLYIVPARVDGTWTLQQGRLELYQEFETLKGTLTADGRTTPVENGTVKLDEITFSAGGITYTGRVKGNTIEGVANSGERREKFTARKDTP
jgi:precorrin-6B methylase 2